MLILAFDPGATTGWSAVTAVQLSYGQFYRWNEVRALIEQFRPDVIVVEDFRLYSSKVATRLVGHRLDAAEVLGCIFMVAEENGVPVEVQRSCDIKGLPMKLAGLTSHMKDAVKHAVVYILKNGLTDKFEDNPRLAEVIDGICRKIVL